MLAVRAKACTKQACLLFRGGFDLGLFVKKFVNFEHGALNATPEFAPRACPPDTAWLVRDETFGAA